MKKTALLLLMTLLITGNTFAQGFGIQLGYNSAKFKELYKGELLPKKDFVHYNSKPGFLIGFNYDIELSENLYVETGLNYQTKGMKELVEGEGYEGHGDLNYDYSFKYLEIPAQLRYNFEIGDDTYIFGIGGFNIGYALSGSVTYDDGHSTETHDFKIGSDKEEDYYKMKRTDIGFAIGAGILYKGLELRLGFNNGLSDIDPTNKGERYNRVFTISAGYRFNM